MSEINRSGSGPQSTLPLSHFATEDSEKTRGLDTNSTLSSAERSTLSTPFARINGRKVSKKEVEVYKELQNAPTKEAYQQILAHEVAYLNLNVGDILPAPTHYNGTSYRVEGLHSDRTTGLLMYALVPLKPHERTIITFRGTVASNLNNLRDDLSQTIGSVGLGHGKKVLAFLQQWDDKEGGLHLMGHSLGGAMAQLATAYFVDKVNIRAVTHFNAPGIGGKWVGRYKKKLKTLPPSLRPIVTAIRHQDDLVPYAGGRSLPPSLIIEARPKGLLSRIREIFGVKSESFVHSNLFLSKPEKYRLRSANKRWRRALLVESKRRLVRLPLLATLHLVQGVGKAWKAVNERSDDAMTIESERFLHPLTREMLVQA